MSEKTVPVLIAGKWRESNAAGVFQADNPSLGQPLPDKYPVSSREEMEEAVQAASEAADGFTRDQRRKDRRIFGSFRYGY